MIDKPHNGEVSVSNDNVPLEDSVLSLTCHEGYILQGNDSSTCSKDGIWIPDPSMTICRGEPAVVNVYTCDLRNLLTMSSLMHRCITRVLLLQLYVMHLKLQLMEAY